jgi:outer membrane protein assembly factor BamB
MNKLLLTLLITTVIYSQHQIDIPWSSLANSPWPMVSRDPQNTHRSFYSGPESATIKWEIDLPYGVLSGPVIGEDGTLYVGTDFYGDTTNYFYAINPDNGEIIWIFSTGNPNMNASGYLINNEGTIFFGSQSGWLYAIDSYGNLKWKYDTGDDILEGSGMNIDLQGNIYFTNSSGFLYSLSKSGSLNWKVIYGGGIFSVSTTMIPSGDIIYVVAADRKLRALNLNGIVQWSNCCIGIDRQPLTVDNSGNIYFLPGYDSYDLNALNCIDSSGNLRWSYLINNGNAGFTESSPTIDYNGNLYYTYIVDSANTWLCRVESVDYYGNYRWTYQFEQLGEEIFADLICDKDGTIYCGSTYGYYYYAISKEGKLLWKLPLNGNMVDNSGAIGSDGTLYIGMNGNPQKNLIAIRDTVTSVLGGETNTLDYNLNQNYPNPFNPSTTINFSLPQKQMVKLVIYDILGKEVKTLVNSEKDAGSYNVEWNGTNNNGLNVSTGIYIYRINAGSFIQEKKMILMK